MGKLDKGVHFTGTIGNLCYYEMGDSTYVRSKSSLTRKRVLKDKAFEKTRKYASNLGLASQIGSEIYRALPRDIKGRWLYRTITGEAASLLYEGMQEQEVKDSLWKKYIHDTACYNEEAIKAGCDNLSPASKESRVQLRKVFYERWIIQSKSQFSFKRVWCRRGVFKPDEIPKRLGFIANG